MSETGPAPDWFRRALAAPRESRFVEVAGCPIHYLRWGDPAQPGLVLIPGTGGHAHWFAHVGPLLADQFNVAAMDIGGAGDSGRRPAYALNLIIEEIMGVCRDAGMLSASVPPIILGHSLSGQFTVHAAIAKGEAFLGVVILDGLRHAVLDKDPGARVLREGRPAPKAQRVYPDRESAVARFRLQPEPEIPIETGYVLEHIAQNSVQAVDGGWSWKYDRGLFSILGVDLELKHKLKDLPCRAAAIYGETSHIVGASLLADMDEATGGIVPVFKIPGTSHFPMIDSPFAFVAAVKGVALAWVAERRRAVHG